MINELQGKDLFYKENDTFKEYFCKRIRNENELTMEILLSRMVLKFYQKVFVKEQKIINRDIFDYDFFNYGYIDNYGYYTIHDAGNGYYAVICYGEDINKSFIDVCQSIIDKNAKAEERENHREIRKIYKNRFGRQKKYKELFFINYALSKWNEFYDGNIPSEIVSMYLKELEGKDMPTSYDLDSHQITIGKGVKTKKLKK